MYVWSWVSVLIYLLVPNILHKFCCVSGKMCNVTFTFNWQPGRQTFRRPLSRTATVTHVCSTMYLHVLSYGDPRGTSNRAPTTETNHQTRIKYTHSHTAAVIGARYRFLSSYSGLRRNLDSRLRMASTFRTRAQSVRGNRPPHLWASARVPVTGGCPPGHSPVFPTLCL